MKLKFKFTETESGYKVQASDGVNFALRLHGKKYPARAQVNYKRVACSTRSACHRTAAANAHAIIAKAAQGDTLLAAAAKKRSPWPTIADLCEAYKTGHAENAEDTRHRNALALKCIIREVLGRDDWNTLRADVIDGDLAAKFLAKRVEGLLAADLKTAKITANSVYRKAKSLFSRRALAAATTPYRAFDLPLTEIRSFLEVPFFSKVKKLGKAKASAAYVEAVVENFPHLREYCPRSYLIALLCAGCGLRLSEAIHARKGWVSDDELVIEETADWETKSREGRAVRLPEHVRAEIALLSDDSEFIVPAGDCHARNIHNLKRPLNKWFREFNSWPFEKTTHELRRWAGSKVLEQTGSMTATRDFLGHSSISVTEEYYAELLAKPVYNIELAAVKVA